MATYQAERFPIVIAAEPGARISLQSIFDQAFGPGWSFDPWIGLYSNTTASQTYVEPTTGTSISFGFWNPANKVDGRFEINGVAVPHGAGKSVETVAGVDLIAGNALTPLLQFAVSNSFAPGKESEFTWYSVTIVPTAMFSGASYAATGASIAAKALEFADRYKSTPLLHDCGWIAEAIAAAAGAPMPVRCFSIKPSENLEGGLWRIVHRGDQTPTPDWQKLVQAGDIVRLDWKEGTFHTTTVVRPPGPDGKMLVVDNGGPNGEVISREVIFDKFAIPESVTIYRLSPDGLYLLEGTGIGEKLNGTTRADDLRGGAGDDELRAGAGDDKIVAGLGNDVIDGGAGGDTVWINALKNAVSVSFDNAGVATLTSADGKDVLKNVELVRFANGETVALSSLAPPPPVVSTYAAAALSQFITGANPTATEMTVRTNAAIAAYDYYANVLKVANPALGPYESLGVSFSSLPSFQSKFGAGDAASFVGAAYKSVFLRDATAGQQQTFLDQLAYFTGIYQQAGASKAVADMQARGAVVGQMIGYVMTVPSEAAAAGQTIDDRAISFVSTVGGQASSISLDFV